ncbi:hypothetical protein NHQ30_005997 [Ciborinia camelliae]|nr:hypothetical protein NHQ30_005997 [Ciborinia camelliae]
MKLSIRPILRHPFTSFTPLKPYHKTFSNPLPSKSVLQVRAFKLPTPTALPEENAASKENAHPESKPSIPTDIASGSSELAKFKAISEEGHSAHLHDSTIQRSLYPFLKENGGKWVLAADGMGIMRTFRFKGFKDAWNFMNTIASQSKLEKHHPEWVNIYNMVFVRWTTHDPPGLTSTDILMAAFCDAHAMTHHEIVDHPQDAIRKGLVDEIAQNEKFLDYAINVGNGRKNEV